MTRRLTQSNNKTAEGLSQRNQLPVVAVSDPRSLKSSRRSACFGLWCCACSRDALYGRGGRRMGKDVSFSCRESLAIVVGCSCVAFLLMFFVLWLFCWCIWMFDFILVVWLMSAPAVDLSLVFSHIFILIDHVYSARCLELPSTQEKHIFKQQWVTSHLVHKVLCTSWIIWMKHKFMFVPCPVNQENLSVCSHWFSSASSREFLWVRTQVTRHCACGKTIKGCQRDEHLVPGAEALKPGFAQHRHVQKQKMGYKTLVKK